MQRCIDCERSLLRCHEDSVRRALATDPLVTRATLEALASDPSGPVAMAAEMALEELDAEEKPSGVIDISATVQKKLTRRQLRNR